MVYFTILSELPEYGTADALQCCLGSLSCIDLVFYLMLVLLDFSWSRLDSMHGKDHFQILLSEIFLEILSPPK